MDAVFIFVGGNDVRVTSDVREIGENILTIAESFSNRGILPIVMPLINRQYPLGIGVDQYNTIRNGVNRYLRRKYRRNGQRHNVLNFNDLKLQEDGVRHGNGAMLRGKTRRTPLPMTSQGDVAVLGRSPCPSLARDAVGGVPWGSRLVRAGLSARQR